MDLHKLFSQSGKKPQSILKIILVISLVLLVMWLILVSKMDVGNVAQSTEPEVQERTIGLHESLKKSGGSKAGGEVARKEPDMFQNAFITFLFMVSVLGGVWYWSKKKEASSSMKLKSREIDSHILSENSQLKFVEINEEIWVLGLGDQGVSLLHRYPKEEWKETNLGKIEQQEIKKNETRKGSFKDLLKLASN